MIHFEDPHLYTITEGLAEYSTVWGKMMTFLQENQFLMIFLVGSLVAMVWKHFMAAKKAVR